MNQEDIDKRMFAECVVAASNSNDPRTQTGAVIMVTRDIGYDVIGLGFNRIPLEMDMDEVVWNSDLKYAKVIHAEMMALMRCRYPDAIKGATMYTLRPPCDRCMAHMIEMGIAECVVPKEVCHTYGVWDNAHKRAFAFAQEVGMTYRHV